MTDAITYTETEYSDGRDTYAAIMVSWDELERLLGRPHEGTPADDNAATDALRESGAPKWVNDAEGWVEPDGWGLIGPRV